MSDSRLINFSKIFLKIIKFVGLFLVGLFIIAFASRYIPKSPRTDAFYLTSAQFAYDELKTVVVDRKNLSEMYDKFQSAPYFQVSLHRLKESSSGAVLSIRTYTPDEPLTIDGDRYRKITIQVKELKSEKINLSDRPDVKVLFTGGGASWPRNGCTAKLNAGFLNIEVVDKIVNLKINAKGHCENFSYPEIEIDETDLASKKRTHGLCGDC